MLHYQINPPSEGHGKGVDWWLRFIFRINFLEEIFTAIYQDTMANYNDGAIVTLAGFS